jgi:hypothetical protein
MLLLTYFVLLFVFLASRRRWSPALLLTSIYLGSLACGVLIGNDCTFSTPFERANLLFQAVMLTMVILPWRRYPFGIAIAEPPPRRLRQITWLLLVIHAIGFSIFLIAAGYAFTATSDYTSFKNSGENMALTANFPLNHTLHLIAIYLNPTAVFLVPLHLYYLVKRRYLLSIACLVLSSNVILEGISIFSRFTVVYYFAFYAMYVPFFYGAMRPRQRRVFRTTAIVLLVASGTVFWNVTANRFSTYLSYGEARYSQSFIKDDALYSMLDYVSQWYKNSNYVMAQYQFDPLGGKLSSPLVLTVADKLRLITYPPDAIVEKLKVLWGDRYDKFVGLIANLLFDFGYAGTTLFVLLYAGLLYVQRPTRGRPLSFSSLMVLGPIFVLPALGFSNSLMKASGYNLLILYSAVLYIYLCLRHNRPITRLRERS